MKVHKYIEIGQEVEIDISSEDIYSILERDGSSLRDILYNINSIAEYFKGIPDIKIVEMTAGQRKTIHGFLLAEAERYNNRLDDDAK